MGKTLGRLLSIGAIGASIIFPGLAPLGIAAATNLAADLLGLGPSAPKPDSASTPLKRRRASSALTISGAESP